MTEQHTATSNGVKPMFFELGDARSEIARAALLARGLEGVLTFLESISSDDLHHQFDALEIAELMSYEVGHHVNEAEAAIVKMQHRFIDLHGDLRADVDEKATKGGANVS